MRISSRFRIATVLAVAVSALTIGAVPAAAETILTNCNGTCGYYEYTDNLNGPTGAICRYESTSFDLDYIRVRPPLMHGPYSTKTPVGWRYKIYRAPVSTGVFSLIYTSGWQNALANTSIPAYLGHGFARRTWYAPEDPHGWFKVRVNLRWKNGAGTVIGTAAAEYDYYKAVWSGNTSNPYFTSQYCLEEY